MRGASISTVAAGRAGLSPLVLSRRRFLKRLLQLLAAGSLSGALAAVVGYFYPTDVQEFPTEPVPAGSPDELTVGAAKLLPFGRYPAMVIRTDQGLRAYVAVCTHFACIVQWDASRGEMACPCHDATFAALDGSVLSGPPPEPLRSLTAEVVDGQIYIGVG